MQDKWNTLHKLRFYNAWAAIQRYSVFFISRENCLPFAVQKAKVKCSSNSEWTTRGQKQTSWPPGYPENPLTLAVTWDRLLIIAPFMLTGVWIYHLSLLRTRNQDKISYVFSLVSVLMLKSPFGEKHWPRGHERSLPKDKTMLLHFLFLSNCSRTVFFIPQLLDFFWLLPAVTLIVWQLVVSGIPEAISKQIWFIRQPVATHVWSIPQSFHNRCRVRFSCSVTPCWSLARKSCKGMSKQVSNICHKSRHSCQYLKPPPCVKAQRCTFYKAIEAGLWNTVNDFVRASLPRSMHWGVK